MELVESIATFIEDTLMRITWCATEISSLVFWVNDLLEDFREAAQAGEDLRRVRLCCTTDDRLLKDLIFMKVHRQVDTMRCGAVEVVIQPVAQNRAPIPRQQNIRDRKSA